MNRSLASLALIVWCVETLATSQHPEYVVYETRLMRLYSEPLEQYEWPEGKKPWFWPAPRTMSTGNARGYVALWEVTGGELFLKAIDASISVD